MAKLADRNLARAALETYLPPSAWYVESAWHSCGVLAQLNPEKSTDLAHFLIAYSQQLDAKSGRSKPSLVPN